MRRIVRRAARAAGAAALTFAGTGCAAGGPAQATPEQRLAAALLSKSDLPAGYLPVANAAMFRGLRTTDRDCPVLLALTDAPAFGGVPRADATFYRANPSGFVAEHLLRAPPISAHEFLVGVRRAATGCRRIVMRSMSYTVGLRRAPLSVRGVGEESYTVRYAGRAGAGHLVHLDIVVARPADGLLILVAETLTPRPPVRHAEPHAKPHSKRHAERPAEHQAANDVAPDVGALIAERAVGKLRGAASIG